MIMMIFLMGVITIFSASFENTREAAVSTKHVNRVVSRA